MSDKRFYVISSALGWRFLSVRLGPVLFDWRWVSTSRFADVWINPWRLHVHFALGEKSTKGDGTLHWNRYGATVSRWTKQKEGA